MINYTEKGAGLHEAIRLEGYGLREENGEWVSTDDEYVQALINNYRLSDAVEHVSKEIDFYAKILRDKADKHISPSELSSWAAKRNEADKFQISKLNEVAPSLTAEAGFRGVTVQSIVNKVISKSDSALNREARISGIAGKHKDALKSFSSFEEVNNYDWLTQMRAL